MCSIISKEVLYPIFFIEFLEDAIQWINRGNILINLLNFRLNDSLIQVTMPTDPENIIW